MNLFRFGLFLVCSLLYAHLTYSQSYTFTTLAGNAGYGSRDGIGRDARFRGPKGVAVDSVGNIYVADTENNTIRKISPGASVSTLAGLAMPGVTGRADGTGSNALFYYPQGVAADSAGNAYVADTLNHTIRKITPSSLSDLGGST